MRALVLPLVIVLLATATASADPTIYLSPDVPTTPDDATYLPWEVVEHRVGAATYGLRLALPGHAAIDALHKMDNPGNWLFSVDEPSDLAGALSSPAEPRDVIRLDDGDVSLFFDGSCTSPAVPAGSDVDAVYLDRGGNLIVGFDVPTTLGAVTVLSSQLVRYLPTGDSPCGWTFVGVEMDFKFGSYFPGSARVTGVGRTAGRWVVSLDIPTDLGPPGPETYTPGHLVSTDGGTWSLFADLQASGMPAWPISSVVNALSCEANPGRIDTASGQFITMDKSLPDVTVHCPASCASGGTSYGLYEGTIASLRAGTYDHVKESCTNSCPGNITVAPGPEDRYYLVVPHNGSEEGSYGLAFPTVERPPAADETARCVVLQTLTSCP